MNVVVAVAAIVAALIGGGGLGGYFGARRTARSTEFSALTSKPHEQLAAETAAFRTFMDEARVQHAEMVARLASCEQKHASSEAERIRQQAEIEVLRARIVHLEDLVADAGNKLGSVRADGGE